MVLTSKGKEGYKYKPAIDILLFLYNTFQHYPIRISNFERNVSTKKLKKWRTQLCRIVLILRTDLLNPQFAVSMLPARDINLC